MYFKPLSDHGLCLDEYPSIHVALRITVVSCSTQQQLLKQSSTPWSVTSVVSTPERAFKVEFLGQKQRNYQKGRRNFSVRREGRSAELGHVVVGTQHSL